MESAHRCSRCTGPVDPQDRICEHCDTRVVDRRRDRVEVDVGVAAGDLGATGARNTVATGARNTVATGDPACAFVSAVVTGGTVTVGWVGDSRAYWIPRLPTESAPSVRLTEDDSWLVQVLAAGTLSAAEAAVDRRAHAITAWLGRNANPIVPHVVTVEPGGPGIVVVCTDGPWNYLDSVDELAAALLAEASEAPLDAARKLVEVALRCGGRDNITVAVLPLNTQPGGAS
ncbi:MAG: PP2C family protein-serine/threonine phosphatase [Pseudonocardiaceae bacterium]